MARYVTVDKYAEIVGRDRITVFRMLAKGRIEGARKVTHYGNVLRWAIPENAPWPESERWKGYNKLDGYLDIDLDDEKPPEKQ